MHSCTASCRDVSNSYQRLTVDDTLRVGRVDLENVAWGDVQVMFPWSWTKH